MESTTNAGPAGRRRLGAAALRNEIAKTIHRPAALVLAGLTLLVSGAQFGHTWWEARGAGGESFALPGAWPEIVGAQVARPALIFGSLLVVLLVASEFSWRTARQNVIDGLSKAAWFRGKATLLVPLALGFLSIQVVPGIAFAAAGTDALSPAALLPSLYQTSAMGGFLLAFLGYGTFALLVALAVRSPGAAVGVWFTYVAVGERLIVEGLGVLPVSTSEVARFLPISLFNELVSYLQHDPAARAEVAAAQGSAPQLWEWSALLPAALGWILLFLAVAFAVHRRRDL